MSAGENWGNNNKQSKLRAQANGAIDFFASPVLLHFLVPCIMAYLIAGTIAQKYIGLYEATQTFFAAPIIWTASGALPLPGFPILMALLALNLTVKLIWKSPWTLRNSGVIVAHLSVLLLLIGGMLTALTSREGFVDLAQGQEKSYVTDYHARTIVIQDKNGRALQVWDFDEAKIGQKLSTDSANLPFTITVLESCQNCEIQKRELFADDVHYLGMAQHMLLTPKPLELEDERNLGGLTVQLNFKSPADENHAAKPKVLTIIEDLPANQQISNGQQSYSFLLQKQRRDLPFSVKLINFKRESYAGTSEAKSYESQVLITDQYGSWESVIRMNEPLRYRGYTLFQSSFLKDPSKGDGSEISVLAIVWNAGRAFPYISGIVLCFGLMLHMLVRRQVKRKLNYSHSN